MKIPHLTNCIICGCRLTYGGFMAECRTDINGGCDKFGYKYNQWLWYYFEDSGVSITLYSNRLHWYVGADYNGDCDGEPLELLNATSEYDIEGIERGVQLLVLFS